MPFYVLSSIAIIYCDITAIVYDVMKHVHFLLKYKPRFLCQLDAFGALISIANVKSLLTMNDAFKCEFTFRTVYRSHHRYTTYLYSDFASNFRIQPKTNRMWWYDSYTVIIISCEKKVTLYSFSLKR